MKIINMLRRQSEIYKELLEEKLSDAKTATDVYIGHSSVFKDFYTHAFRPMLDDYTTKNIDSKKMNEIITKTTADIDIAFDEIEHISNTISESFNSNQEYKTGLRNRIEYLMSIIEDVNLMEEDSLHNTIVFKDSLTSHDFIDRDFGSGTHANISTSEGIAFLAIRTDTLLNENIESIKLNGNGEAGNHHTIKKVNVETFNDDFNMYSKFKSDENSHSDPQNIVDNQPSTWLEYQKLGISPYDKEKYNIPWGNADKIKDDLTLKINIELDRVSDINWIDISPYLPERSKSNISLYSVKTSEDGSNFSSVYRGEDVIDKDIFLISQNYAKESLFTKDNVAKFTSQGVLNFPLIKAKFIEIILKQTKPYDELLGVITYTKIMTSGQREVVKGMMEEQAVPLFIVQGPVGKYKVSPNEYIIKQMVVMDGWRYIIGVRNIGIYNRIFERQSEIITKQFETNKNIKKIMLYANEIIPDDFNEYGLEKRNDWIKYYISINDIDWHQISPMHHNPVGKLTIPPKIYEINSIESVEEKSINKGYLNSNEDVNSVRLKIVFSGPGNMATSTPILEEYALKCIVEGGLE